MLSVSGSTFSGNAARDSGGTIAIIGSPGAAATVSGSTFSGNSAPYGGGAIQSGGTLSLSDSAFNGNAAGGGFSIAAPSSGGGILNGGTLTIADCSFKGNEARVNVGAGVLGPGSGGGIANSGILTIAGSAFSGNSASNGEGGGIANSGTLTVTESTLRDNSGGRLGGGISNSGTLRVAASTLSGNRAAGGTEKDGTTFPGSGGGLSNSGTLTVTNATISGNSAPGGEGGGIENSGGELTVAFATVSGNSASGGGGIHFIGDTLTVTDSLLSGNSGGSLAVGGGAASSLSHNLFSDAPGLELDSTNMIDTDPLLGPLADNGGPTMTLALLPGSPAIDAAIPLEGITTDQRGVPRPQGAAPDIGAFESRGFTIAVAGGDSQSTQAGSAFPEPLAVTVASPDGEPVAGGRVTFQAPMAGAGALLVGNPATIADDGRASVMAVANSVPGSFVVTAQAAGAAGVGFNLTNTQAAGPTVVALRRLGYHLRPTRLMVLFDRPMNAARAEDLANYRLVAPGADRRLGTRDDRPIRIASASYDPFGETVTLRPRPLLPLNQRYQLTVRGTPPTGLTDTAGTFLAGSATGQPGSDYVADFGRENPLDPAAAAPHHPPAFRFPIRRQERLRGPCIRVAAVFSDFRPRPPCRRAGTGRKIVTILRSGPIAVRTSVGDLGSEKCLQTGSGRGKV